ncbi:hypothetical protein [Glutamicibacter arilaitensis]|uniref:hypothetical protein n=1 Tax=Glutamicibacter arilaitensis TaxID=256701 RepID=UPI00384DEA7B
MAVSMLGVTACGGVDASQGEASAVPTPTVSESPVVFTPNPMDTVAPPEVEDPSTSSDEPYWLDTGSGVVQEIELDLERSGGYKASAHVEWYAPREVEASSIPLLKNLPDADDLATRAIRVNVVFTPETVNGFEWPSDAPFGLVISDFGSNGPSGGLGIGYSYLDESGAYVPVMETETGVMYYSDDGEEMKVAADIIYFAKKTPEKPEGDWTTSYFGTHPTTIAIPYCVPDQSAKGIKIKDGGITLRAAQYGVNEAGCWLMPEKVYSDPLAQLPVSS